MIQILSSIIITTMRNQIFFESISKCLLETSSEIVYICGLEWRFYPFIYVTKMQLNKFRNSMFDRTQR